MRERAVIPLPSAQHKLSVKKMLPYLLPEMATDTFLNELETQCFCPMPDANQAAIAVRKPMGLHLIHLRSQVHPS
jgi:hypothetical protein